MDVLLIRLAFFQQRYYPCWDSVRSLGLSDSGEHSFGSASDLAAKQNEVISLAAAKRQFLVRALDLEALFGAA
jgi:hypothetical protein